MKEKKVGESKTKNNERYKGKERKKTDMKKKSEKKNEKEVEKEKERKHLNFPKLSNCIRLKLNNDQNINKEKNEANSTF